MDQNPYTAPNVPVEASSTQKPNSRLAIASFVIGLFTVALNVGLFIFSRVLSATAPGDIEVPAAIIILSDILGILSRFGGILAVIFGVASLIFQRGRRRLFAAWGIVLGAVGIGVAFFLL